MTPITIIDHRNGDNWTILYITKKIIQVVLGDVTDLNFHPCTSLKTWSSPEIYDITESHVLHFWCVFSLYFVKYIIVCNGCIEIVDYNMFKLHVEAIDAIGFNVNDFDILPREYEQRMS